VAQQPEPVASVVIPAHDEARVLATTLTTLLADARPGELDVVVVPNACRDGTADVARAHGVRVVETTVPGKAHALRLGDAACVAFPRVYLDADVLLSAADVRALAAALQRPGVLAASPAPRFDLTAVRPLARRLHRVHEAMMAGRRGLAGAGVYALGPAGHDRVFPLPDVISDDGLVHRSFAPHERAVVASAASVVRPAATFGEALQRRVRVRQGNHQLAAMGVPLPEGRLGLRRLLGLVRSGQVGPVDAAAYLALMAADRTQVWWRRRRGAGVRWGSPRG